MRDSFDHYFSGWNLDPDEPEAALAEFAILVEAVGSFIKTNPAIAEEWRVFPLDGKKECFFHFVKRVRDAGGLPASTQPLLAKLKADYPRTFA